VGFLRRKRRGEIIGPDNPTCYREQRKARREEEV
jgi:hypothetical protein